MSAENLEDVEMVLLCDSSGELQAKWVSALGSSEKSFMGGFSFQGVRSWNGVDEVL